MALTAGRFIDVSVLWVMLGKSWGKKLELMERLSFSLDDNWNWKPHEW